MHKYHHIGIPTDIPRENETYLDKPRMYVSGYEESPYGVEWMRFESDSPLPELVKTLPHVAFEVDDLEAAIQGKEVLIPPNSSIQGKEVLIPPNSPSKGIRVAFIVDNGAPIEFIEIE